jgi:hypothetical protein
VSSRQRSDRICSGHLSGDGDFEYIQAELPSQGLTSLDKLLIVLPKLYVTAYPLAPNHCYFVRFDQD